MTVALTGYFFDKTVANLTTGLNPATTAAPATGSATRCACGPPTLRSRISGSSTISVPSTPDRRSCRARLRSSRPGRGRHSNTSSTGGTNGTGVLDIRNLNVFPSGEVLIEFDITLSSTLSNGTVVTNQSAVRLGDGSFFASSDDPNVNGTANPGVSGDEDPTRVTIASAPVFQVRKISTDLTGDPNVLLAGETLRYTITVKNVGNGYATNVVLRDLVP